MEIIKREHALHAPTHGKTPMMIENSINVENLPRCSKADIMRKYGGVIDIIVSMNSIDSIDHWNSKTCG